MVCLPLITQVIGATGLLAQQAFAISQDAPCVDEQLSNFIVKNRPVALQGILNNIGPDGAKVAGAASGLVIASPSKANPDCKQAMSQLSNQSSLEDNHAVSSRVRVLEFSI